MGEVDDYVKRLSPDMRKITNRLRTIIKKALPNSNEVIKWRNPTYLVDGENVAWIINYRDHTDLGFFKGALLHSDLLEGTGKGLRHIKVYRYSDIKEKEFARLLKEAAKLSTFD